MEKIQKDRLLISSDFYSVQGEGISTGIPSYFIRLSHCNLACGMSNDFLRNLRKAGPDALADGELVKGDLELKGKATWTCDSVSQWAIRGTNREYGYLQERWKQQGIYSDVLNGSIHLIWTGGEPMMPKHQDAIYYFLDYLYQHSSGNSVYNEVETNGTYVINDLLYMHIDQINCSPKLSNSGMDASIRIVPAAIKRIMQHSNYQFKFVISTEEDWFEIVRDFVKPFEIPLSRVVCMPGMDSQEDYHERTQFVLEMAKKYRFRGMSRLHISAWDKTLNV